ncbi:MAG: SURF1-like protein [Pseudomonadota bacterium]|nr:SURF1-like protein [Pseudomonadota bacterium]MDQ1344790.1 SURF1-like protein [Pseudomonadota bacterium]
MSLRIGKRSFAPPVWTVVLTALGVAIFVALGYWQLGRAQEKQARFDAFMSGSEDIVDATGLGFDELARYQRVRLRGSYDATRQILLDNMPSAAGRPGYRVLTPLERADGRGWVLVDRGWVPLGLTRDELPNVAVGAGERELTGTLDGLPIPGVRVGPAAAPGAASWPRVLLFPTEPDVESILGVEVESRMILLDAGVPDGFERKWRPALGFGPERHLGYAVQWFAFALVAIVLFVALNLKRAGPEEDSLES